MNTPKYTLRRGKQRRRYTSPRSSEEEQTTSNRTVAGSTPAGDAKQKYVVVLIVWEETERGWGVRPDGASLHLTIEDSRKYIDEYWASMPPEAPDEYSRPSSGGQTFEVDDEVYQRIKQTKNGLRVWQHEFRELKK